MNELYDPFGGTAENWSTPDQDWPPQDPTALAQLDQWADEQEAAGSDPFTA